MVIFHRNSTRWVEAVCPGRFKHVSMAGFVPETKSWVVLSWELARLRTGIVMDADFVAWLPEWAGPSGGCLLVRSPDFDIGSWRPRLGLVCVSMACHVLGLRGGALLPDGLWRLLLANGAQIVADGTENRDPRTDRVGEGPAAGRRARPA
jgi:hypothetical protein